MKLRRQCAHTKYQDEEIEGIEGPAQKARDECIPLYCGQTSKPINDTHAVSISSEGVGALCDELVSLRNPGPADASIGFSINNQKSSINNRIPMPELDPPQRQTTDTLMLTGFWYRALPADRIHRNRLHKATL